MNRYFKNRRAKIILKIIVTILVSVTLVFFGKRCYKNYLLAQKILALPNTEDVYEIQFARGGQWSFTLTDEKYIKNILELLPEASATDKTIIQIEDYTVYIRYINENGEKDGIYYNVITRDNNHFVYHFYEEGLWQINDDLYSLMNETILKLSNGELQ